ncbi:MAG: YkgJ family cysteine cluster protein [Planctomycetes bacterium]|nr:YkgJ family cysteine cluster protein [Planctomycetota bacterium]
MLLPPLPRRAASLGGRVREHAESRTRCGHCRSGGSGHVWIEEREIEPMALALGMSAERFVERHVRLVAGRLSLREQASEGGRCALLIGKNTCAVYAARSEHCRHFPYWESVLADPAAFEAARATCPGIAVFVDEELRARGGGVARAVRADRGALRSRSSRWTSLRAVAAGSPSKRSTGAFRCATRTGAYLPRPRAHLPTYHGILAPAAEWRDLVVPGPRAKSSPCAEPRSSSPGLEPCNSGSQNCSPGAQSCT